jgi:hypothetical protein
MLLSQRSLICSFIILAALLGAPPVSAQQPAPQGEEPGVAPPGAAQTQPAAPPAPPALPPPPPPGYVVAQPVPYHAVQRPPSTGLPLIITGSVMLGVGVLNLATSPICKSSAVSHNMQDTCLYLSLGLGGGLVAAGTPLLIVGAGQRGRYNEWRKHQALATALSGLRLSLNPQNLGVGWGVVF